MIKDFRGEAKALDAFDIPMLAYRIAVSEDHLQAFLNVESRSQGFDRSGRPIILNEPHVFYRNLRGTERDRAVAAGLAYPRWGEKSYPKTQDGRYEWLMAAQEINSEAALKSCSWGSTQILGENFAMIGYLTAAAMVRDFMSSEEAHVEGMVNFILATGIADDMRAGRWATVARVYNGPGYKKNRYDTKLAAEYKKLQGIADSGWVSDTKDAEIITLSEADLKTYQRRLGDLGYTEVGWADGKWGVRTRAATLAFRADNGLPLVAGVTEDLMAALMMAPARKVSEERQQTDAQGLREAGSRIISGADKAKAAGGLLVAGGGLTTITQTLDDVTSQIDGLQGVIGQAQEIIESASGIWPVLLIAVGAYVIYQQVAVQRARVDDHKTGKNSFPGGL